MTEYVSPTSADEPDSAFEEQLLFNLVYCSQVSDGIDQTEVDAIVATARRFNPALGITGVLVFGSGVFFQWIEGPKTNVLELVNRIEADSRHKQMTILSSDEEIRERIFPTWDMELVGAEDIRDVLEDALHTAQEAKNVDALKGLIKSLDDHS